MLYSTWDDEERRQNSPKSETIAGHLCIGVVEVIVTQSSPRVEDVDLKTSGIRRIFVTVKSHGH